MGVKLGGASGKSLSRMGTAATVLGVLGGVGFYLYGPPMTPTLHGAAAAKCNEITGGNYRSYRLDWVVDTRPHWLCGDAARPAEEPVNLGWMVIPSVF